MTKRTRTLILAQVPPPTHGQSVMVGHLVTAARQTRPDDFVHINLRFSRDLQDVGTPRFSKLFTLAGYAARMVWNFALGKVNRVYYVPAPAKRGPLLRDAILLSLARIFRRRIVLHWHAVGLGAHTVAHPDDRWAARVRKLINNHALSICLSKSAARDVQVFHPQHVAVVPNGIPDPCDCFDDVLRERQARLALRRTAISDGQGHVTVRLLYLGYCVRSKGIFRALDAAAALTNSLNQSGRPVDVVLTLAGTFADPSGEAEFEREAAAVMAAGDGTARGRLSVLKAGFSDAAAKRVLLRESDIFLFPTRYENEGQPLTILESMAWGLPVVTTTWRGIPETLPSGYPFLSDSEPMSDLPNLLERALLTDCFQELRDHFTERYTIERHTEALLAAIAAA